MHATVCCGSCFLDPPPSPLRDAGITADTSGLTDRRVDHERDEAVRQSTERPSIYGFIRVDAYALYTTSYLSTTYTYT